MPDSSTPKPQNSKPLNNDQLGAKGEAEFTRLCTDSGLTCNPSTRDRGGWDFIVETPPQAGGSFDTRQTGLSCHVQTKTMWADSVKRITLTLSVAERLAKEPKPAFVAVIVVNDDLSLSHLHLVHFRGAFLERVLKALRKAQTGAKPLHRIELTFSIDVGERIEPTGAALRASIERAVGPNMRTYMNGKQTELTESGFTPGRYQMNATLSATPNELIEAFLEPRALEASAISHSEIRFGIVLPIDPLPDGARATLSIEPQPMDKAVLRVFDGSGSAPAVFSADVFMAPPQVAGGRLRAKIRTAFFTIDLHGDGRVDFASIPDAITTKSYDITAWKNYFRTLATSGLDKSRIEIAPEKIETFSITMRKAVDDGTAEVGRVTAAMCEHAEFLLASAGAASPELSHAELFHAADAVEATYAVVSKDASAFPLAFAHVPELPEAPLSIAYANFLRLGAITLGIGALVEMRLGDEQGERIWRAGSINSTCVRVIRDDRDGYDKFVADLRADFGVEHVGLATWADRTEGDGKDT